MMSSFASNFISLQDHLIRDSLIDYIWIHKSLYSPECTLKIVFKKTHTVEQEYKTYEEAKKKLNEFEKILCNTHEKENRLSVVDSDHDTAM